MSTIQGVSYAAIPWASEINGTPPGNVWRDTAGFPPCKLYFPTAPTSGTIAAIYSNGSAPCSGTLFAASGTRLAVIPASTTGLNIPFSGGQPYFIAQTGSTVFVTFA